MALNLTPERGLLFRITHIANLPWLLAHGLHCARSRHLDPNFVEIGNHDLIGKRPHRAVPLPPGGTLADYVPFYFTPKSIMLLNIQTGHNGVTQRSSDQIVILFSSFKKMREAGVSIVFTDRHAYTALADWSADPAKLGKIVDWDILCRHDFARDDDYPDKKERYQAEALAHGHVPPQALLGIACWSDAVSSRIEGSIRAAGLDLPVFVRPGWYF